MDFVSSLLRKKGYGYDISGLVKDDGPNPDSATGGAAKNFRNLPSDDDVRNEQDAMENQHEKEKPHLKIRPRRD